MKKTRRRKKGGSTGRGLMGALFKGTQRLPAHVSDEPEWYLDGAEVKLTRVFTIVLILHLVAVGGILAFKMIEKASEPSVVVASSKSSKEESNVEVSNPESSTKVAVVKAPVKEALKVERRNPVVVEHPSRKGMSVYRVSKGETLVDIAREQGVSVSELRRLNDLHSGDQLYAGKWLTVPDSKKVTVGNGDDSVNKDQFAVPPKTVKAKPVVNRAASEVAHAAKSVKAIVAKPVTVKKAAPVKKKTAVAAAKKGSAYTVQSGDNLYAIARKTGVSYSKLIALNQLDKPELLKVGQVLKLN